MQSNYAEEADLGVCQNRISSEYRTARQLSLAQFIKIQFPVSVILMMVSVPRCVEKHCHPLGALLLWLRFFVVLHRGCAVFVPAAHIAQHLSAQLAVGMNHPFGFIQLYFPLECYFGGLSPALSFGDLFPLFVVLFVTACVIVLFALLFKCLGFVQMLESASASFFLVVSLSQFPRQCVGGVTGVLVGPVLVRPSPAWSAADYSF